MFLAYVFQSHEEDDRKVRRREKNRVAAQRSRKKQTQKADKLHEVNGYLMFCRHGLGTECGTLQEVGLPKQMWACLHANPAERAVGVRQRQARCRGPGRELPDTDAHVGWCSSAIGDTARERHAVLPSLHPPSFAIPVTTQ